MAGEPESRAAESRGACGNSGDSKADAPGSLANGRGHAVCERRERWHGHVRASRSSIPRGLAPRLSRDRGSEQAGEKVACFLAIAACGWNPHLGERVAY